MSIFSSALPAVNHLLCSVYTVLKYSPVPRWNTPAHKQPLQLTNPLAHKHSFTQTPPVQTHFPT